MGAPGPYSCRTRRTALPRAARRQSEMRSWTQSWLSNPEFRRVITAGQAADCVEGVTVPDILRVEPRPDPLYELAVIVRKNRGRRRKSAEYLYPADEVRVMKAAHVHPDLVMAPSPQRD